MKTIFPKICAPWLALASHISTKSRAGTIYYLTDNNWQISSSNAELEPWQAKNRTINSATPHQLEKETIR